MSEFSDKKVLNKSWADADDDDEGPKLPPLPSATSSKAKTDEETTKSDNGSKADEQACKQEADVLVLSSGLSRLGNTSSDTSASAGSGSVAVDDADDSGNVQEQLHLLKPYESHVSEQMFTDECFKIPAPILDALVLDMKKEKPFKIQASTLPYILQGRNIIAQAQAGAGKTIAFVIGMLARIDTKLNKLQAICLTPTRELATQIMTDAIDKLKPRIDPPVKTELLLSGKQIARNSKSGAHIVVGTPGKVVECFTKKYISLKHVCVFVLDEADFMVQETEGARSMGSETLMIRGELPKTAQVMFFSATYTSEMFDRARVWVPRAVTFKLASDEELMMEKIFKVVIDVRSAGGKLDVLKELYSKLSMQQSIVFVERRKEADSVSGLMNRSGYEVSCLHSDLKGPDRDGVMQRFRDSVSRVLITTNVLARGVDVPSVAVVINFDLPVKHGLGKADVVPDYTTFVHRIGRTGRAERAGTAICLVENEADIRTIRSIDHYFTSSNSASASSSQSKDGASTKSMFTWWDAKDISGLVTEVERRQAEHDA